MLICFSHLRWDFVWQRPQHLLSRFARHIPVVVVEEPAFVLAGDRYDLRIAVDHDVTVLTPLFPAGAALPPGFNERTNPAIRALLTPICGDLGAFEAAAAPPILWYYTPMALGAEPADLASALVVFDAMDELAAFRGAPAALHEREAALLAWADLVFAGGPSLYAARRDRHPAVFCFPSGVERAHFARAAGTVACPAHLAARPRPILGFYGVLDERLDLDLLGAVADARPQWTIALIGPLAKIAADDLPRRPNIVYAGKQAYDDLPGFLSCFDAAILPFARNEATRFISPTKTLEYLAGDKPVVSTPIPDVVALYGEVVAFGDTPAAFIAAVEHVLAEPPSARSRRQMRAHAILAEHDWDAVANRMWTLTYEARRERAGAARPAPLAAREPPATRTPGCSIT